MKNRIVIAVFSVVALCWIALCLSGDSILVADEGLNARVFEMRTYTTAEGRLDVLHKRFRDHTNYLFVKHGMTLIGYWTPVEKPETLVYILAYPSMEARKKSWDGFMNDEAWKKAWADSKKDGPVVIAIEAQFLNPTDYSPIR
jgi:hypothetical protein